MNYNQMRLHNDIMMDATKTLQEKTQQKNPPEVGRQQQKHKERRILRVGAESENKENKHRKPK